MYIHIYFFIFLFCIYISNVGTIKSRIATTLTDNCWCVGQPTSAKYVNNPQLILYNLPVSIIVSIHMLKNRFTVKKNKYLSCLSAQLLSLLFMDPRELHPRRWRRYMSLWAQGNVRTSDQTTKKQIDRTEYYKSGFLLKTYLALNWGLNRVNIIYTLISIM